MICPYCQTENRDDRESCYYCNKDLSMLRLIVNKAKHHYNQALEFAERNRLDDAIGELKNALDLDETLVSAQVVLGTLYAKKEMFSEACQCWNRALALNHHFEKAHDYLVKAESAQYVFPVMKRLKTLSLGLSGLLVILLVLCILFGVSAFSTDPALSRVRESANLLRDGDAMTGQAVQILDAVGDQKKASPIALDIADGVKAQVQREWEERLDLTAGALNNRDPYSALLILDSTLSKSPSLMIRKSLGRLRQRADQQMSELFRDAADDFFAGQYTFERLRDEADHFLSVNKSGPARDEVVKLYDKARQVQRERLVSEATVAAAQAPIAEAARTIKDYEGRAPELGPRLHALLDARLAREAAKIQTAIGELTAQGAFDKARGRLPELSVLYQTAQRPVSAELFKQSENLIAEGERHARDEALRRALNETRQAYAGKDWEKFLKLSQHSERLTGNAVELAQFAAQRQEAQAALAVATWQWYQQRADAYDSGRLTPDEAARTLQTYEQTLAHLPASLAGSQGSILYFAAAAHARLGQIDRARELLARLRQQFPKARILKNAAKLQKKLEPAAPEPKTKPKAKTTKP